MYYNGSMNMIFVCCIPFFIAAAFHLTSCLLSKTKRADVSKKILMPLLILAVAAAYCLSFAGKRVTDLGLFQIVLLCIAVAAGNAGDIFLLGDVTPKNMSKGLGAFLIGHIVYIALLSLTFSLPPVPRLIAIVVFAVYAAAVYVSWRMNGSPKGAVGAAVIVYASVLGLFSLLTLFYIIGCVHVGIGIPGPLLKIYIGTLFFLLSDSVLSHTIFFKQFYQSRFVVMLTYLSAQFLIVLGFLSI